MNKWAGWLASALLLSLLPLRTPAASAGAVAASPVPGEQLEAILDEHRKRGYPSPRVALERLLAGGDAQDGLPLDLRRRYFGRVSYLADIANRPQLARQARARLERMAAGGCLPCRAELLMARAQQAVGEGNGGQALSYLAEADTLIPTSAEQMRMDLAYAEVYALDAAGRTTAAIGKAVAAIRMAEQLGNTGARVRLLIALAGLNADLGHFDRAMAVADEAMALAEPLDYAEAMALVWLNRGHIHSLRNDRKRQYRALTAALEITGAVPGMEQSEVIGRSNLADYYLYRREYAAALEHASRAAALAREIDYERGLAVALANAGIALSHLGRFEEGVAALRESIALARGIGNKGYVAGITRELVKVLEQAGRYRDALQAMHQVADIEAQITRAAREKAVLEVQERYASERKTREIERLAAENRAKQAELEARSWRQRLWAVLALALVLAVTMLVQWLTRSHRMNRHLKRANRNLAEEILHDPLTGAFNRRHFDRLMARLSRVPGTPVGLMVLDVDHFKRVNDRHGHVAGDAVLVQVRQRLSGLLREQDAVVRWGGEEFVLVLPGTSPEGLAVLAGRVLRAVGATPVTVGERHLPVTVSIGAVAHPLGPESPWEEAFRLADAAMYLAKQSGRDRAVCVAALDPSMRPGEAAADLDAAEQRGGLALVRMTGPSVGSVSVCRRVQERDALVQ